MYEDIKELLQSGVLNKHFPGATYCVVHKNGDIYCDKVGYKSLYPTKIPLVNDTIYDIASLSKVISTTTCIMKLIEDEKLSLEDKVSHILSRFKHSDITIYHLLTHTSGLQADIENASALRNEEEVFNKIYNYELINNVGEKIVYSDIGFILLGKIIEVITDKSLDQYAEETIFKPLGMKDTSYFPKKELCAPTELREDNVFSGYLQGLVHDEKSFALNGISGHAGLFSTSKDIAKFILAILNEEFVLNKHLTNELFKIREECIGPSNNLLVRALGWEKPTRGGTAGDYVDRDNTILHTGFTGCNMFIERKKGIGFVLLSNGVHPKRERNKIGSYRNEIGNMIIKERLNEK